MFRKWDDQTLDHLLQHVVHPFYRYEYVHTLFTANIFPTCIDNITYDGVPSHQLWLGDNLGVQKLKDCADKVSTLMLISPR